MTTITGYSCRRQYHAMVAVLDRVLANVTAALKQKGMWGNLLMVFTSDNGGQNKWPNVGGNNFPLVRYGNHTYGGH